MTHTVISMRENLIPFFHSWPMNDGSIHLKPDENNTPAFSYLRNGIVHEISEVNSPIPRRQETSLETWKAVCPLSYPRLVRLQDGSYKLYLNIRGVGGMMEEHQKESASTLIDGSNSEVTERVQKALPEGTFSSIKVLKEGLDKGLFSSKELLSLSYERFNTYDPVLGSALELFDEDSLVKGTTTGLLSSIPGIVKDNIF